MTAHERIEAFLDDGSFEEEFKDEIQGEIPESEAEKLQTVGDVTKYIEERAG